ncbi:MAG: SAM-dependent methyltransferase [Acidobacteria bacterium]|nr:MAG: SAM-dependent methyltransferase [Acidobacteriota bacterium]
MSFSDHFSGVSPAYAEFRPGYPKELFDWLAGLPPRRDLAWDCGTGSGQAAVALASRFDRVIATDASAGQIAAASPHQRVDYRVASAQASGIESGSVDLVAVAQALHWFDTSAFFAEARRVLRPDGAIAAWTYGNPRVDDPRADEILWRFTTGTIGPWWPPERELVDSGYRTIDFPFAEVEAPGFEMEARWTLPELLGYIGTWSGVARFRAARGGDPDPLEELAKALDPAWGAPRSHRRIMWPLAVRAGRRKRFQEVSP